MGNLVSRDCRVKQKTKPILMSHCDTPEMQCLFHFFSIQGGGIVLIQLSPAAIHMYNNNCNTQIIKFYKVGPLKCHVHVHASTSTSTSMSTPPSPRPCPRVAKLLKFPISFDFRSV